MKKLPHVNLMDCIFDVNLQIKGETNEPVKGKWAKPGTSSNSKINDKNMLTPDTKQNSSS